MYTYIHTYMCIYTYIHTYIHPEECLCLQTPVLPHVLGQVRHGRGAKGQTQVLEAEPRKTLNGNCNQGNERYAEGPDHQEGKHISRCVLDFSGRAGLNAFPYDISLRSELKRPNISEKI